MIEQRVTFMLVVWNFTNRWVYIGTYRKKGLNNIKHKS